MLQVERITKRFGATQALRGVSLTAQPGRVLALIGENGAGKSTLMKILSGALAPDAGTMSLGGQPYLPAHPQAARQAGVAMIYQELNLAPQLSVEDNIMLGQERHTAGVIRRSEQRLRVVDALTQLGHGGLDVRTPVGELPVALRQIVEIARALVSQAKYVVFDEPTSSLTQSDVRQLFKVIRVLRAAGLAIVYISHFLEEIRQLCDEYAVLRDGASVGSGTLSDVTDPELVRLMVGRQVEDLFPRVPHTPGEVVLELRNVSGKTLPRGVNVQIRRGEIFGLAGLVGAGRTETLRCLVGLDALRSGQIVWRGAPLTGSVGQRQRLGFGLVSEDRKLEGLALTRSIADNFTYSHLAPYSRAGWLNLTQRERAVRLLMQQLAVKAHSPEQLVGELSGGNQQKVAIGRLLHQQAEVWLLDEPTRGIDVGTKSEIYRLMGELAAAGKTVLFVSSSLPELLAICDRVGVMARGELRETRSAADWTEDAVMQVAIG